MNLKKILAMLLALCLLISLFAACGGSGDSESSNTSSDASTASDTGSTAEEGGEDAGTEPEELTLPLCEEKEELEVWSLYDGTLVSDLNDIEGVKKMEELTNVHINWIPISQEEGSEKMGIMLSSSSYPDIVYPASYVYPGGVEKGIEDGVIYPDHDSLIRKYMPNYMKYISMSEEAKKEAASDDGKMKTLKVIVGKDGTAESEGTYMGLAYRKDLLDGLNIEQPTTIAQWHDALVTAKQSGIEYPLMLDTDGSSPLTLSFGVVSTTASGKDYLQIEDGKVTSGVLTEGYKEYLDTMRQWYSEGLINPNFTSFNYYLDTPSSVENNECLLYSIILSAFTGSGYSQMHMINNADAFLEPITAPLLNEGDEPVQCAERIIAKDSIFITTSCEKPELAAKWLDFQYSEEGERLNWYGIEGTTYELDSEGIPQFTDMVLSDPNGVSAGDVLQKYCLNWGNCWLGKHNTSAGEKVSNAAAGGETQAAKAVDIWSSPAVNLSTPARSWTTTSEEGDEVNTKLTAITTLIQEHSINYIIGEDNTSYEDFREQLIQYGYQDIIDIYQAVYDRYMAR